MVEDRRKRGPNRRLDSWKEIASYFGRDERTVKRWEKERGLPVQRLPGARGGVFAFSDDLAQWMGTSAHATKDLVTTGASAIADASTSSVTQSHPDEAVAIAVLEAHIASKPEISAAEPGANERRSQTGRLVLVFCLLVVAVGGAFVLSRQRHWPASIGITTSGAGPRLAKHHVPKAEAQELYLQGRYFWNKRTPADLEKARDYFTQAIVIDSEYAEAYGGLADCYNLLREYSAMPENEAYPRAIAAAKKAIELDGSLAEAHNSLAFDTFYWSFDAAGAEREYRRALELNPDYALAHHWYATFLMALGRNNEALEQIELAQRLDSSSTSALADKGLILYHAGRTEEAIALLKQVAEREPSFLSTHRYLAMIDLMSGNLRDYLAEAREAALLSGNETELAIVEAGEKGLRENGPQTTLRAILAEEKKLYSDGRLSAYRLAETSALLGDKQQAITYLRAAHDRHDLALAGMLADPPFIGLRGDSSFRELLSQVGLPLPVGS